MVGLWALWVSAWAGDDLRARLDAVAEGADVAPAEAASRAARAEAWGAALALVPTVSASGGYTRNQYAVEVEIPTGVAGQTDVAVLTPLDQLDLTVQARLRVLDVGAWMRVGAAAARADAAAERVADVTLIAQREVVSAWYAAAGADALELGARELARAAAADLELARARFAAGSAASTEVARADAALAQANQRVVEAEEAGRVARRALVSRTGLPAPEGMVLPDSLEAEAPLEAWANGLDRLPEVAAAWARAAAARRDAGATWAGLLPTVAATAGERVTNAAGFGPSAAWSVGVQAEWALAAADGAAASARAAVASEAEAQWALARRDAEARVEAAWDRVASLRARAAAAVASEVSARALGVALRASWEAGSATLAEVTDAEADAAAAMAARVGAMADLAAARADLRLLSGRGEEVR